MNRDLIQSALNDGPAFRHETVTLVVVTSFISR